MPRLVSREFDPARPTYARRKFIANGRRFASGDVFDWRRMSLNVRKAKQMFDSGHLGHKDEEPKLVEPKPDVKAEAALKELAAAGQYWEKEVEVEVEDNEILAAATDDLDAIDDMKELRIIADEEGAPYKVSKADQRKAIRDNRKGTDA